RRSLLGSLAMNVVPAAVAFAAWGLIPVNCIDRSFTRISSMELEQTPLTPGQSYPPHRTIPLADCSYAIPPTEVWLGFFLLSFLLGGIVLHLLARDHARRGWLSSLIGNAISYVFLFAAFSVMAAPGSRII